MESASPNQDAKSAPGGRPMLRALASSRLRVLIDPTLRKHSERFVGLLFLAEGSLQQSHCLAQASSEAHVLRVP